MSKQIPVDRGALEGTEAGTLVEITSDVAYQRLAIVNVIFVGAPSAGDRNWVLVDAGVAGVGSTKRIEEAASERFSVNSRPAAIVMTHGHFDHVGALEELADRWDAPIYAHDLELPYLNGAASYPPPDPSVGGGMMAKLSGLYPRGPIDVSGRLQTLPTDGSIPGMPDWRWVHTPGHTPGHVSLWRESDRTLIAGDAFITTRQESAYAVLTQKPEVHGPPMYYTQDWQAARQSVQRLADLEPAHVITGHGHAMGGPELREALRKLASDFDRIAVPTDGYYVHAPAGIDEGAYRSPTE